MNILLLEDRGCTIYCIMKFLESNGYNILNAYNVLEAQSHWMDRKQFPLHSIVLDLQVPMIGLTIEQMKDAEGGTLAGWIWIRDVVLFEEPDMREKIIIFSEYIEVLKQKEKKNLYRGIKLISKRSGNSIKTLLESINKIII